MKERPPQPSARTTALAASGMGFIIAVPIAIGAIAGNYLDGYLHIGPLFLLLGLLLGLIAGIYGAYRLFKSVFR